MENLHGQVISRKFDYEKNENPTIVSYLYGVVKIVRPVTLVTRKGNLIDRYEVAYKDITGNPTLENMIKHGNEDKIKEVLDFIISHREFDTLEKFIFTHIV